MCKNVKRQQYFKKLILYICSQFLQEIMDINANASMEIIIWEHMEEVETYLKETAGDEEGVLVISDDGEVCNQMNERSIPVVAFLHEENERNHFWKIPYAIENINVLNIEYLEQIYRRYRGIPWDILETERCILREIMVEDVDCIAKIYESPTVRRFMEPLYTPIEKEKEYTRDYIKHVYGFYEYGTWVVVEKTHGKIIGRAGLESYDDNEAEAVELGYLIADEHQRQGYGYEVCSAILKYAEERLGIIHVDTNIETENIASICLCERLGFRCIKKIIKKGKEYYKYRFQNCE